MQFAQAGTPTAGFIFNIGSGIAAGGGIFHYTMNVHIHDTIANGAWGGLKLIPDELYAFVDHKYVATVCWRGQFFIPHV